MKVPEHIVHLQPLQSMDDAPPRAMVVLVDGEWGEARRDATGTWWWAGAEDFEAPACFPIEPIGWYYSSGIAALSDEEAKR